MAEQAGKASASIGAPLPTGAAIERLSFFSAGPASEGRAGIVMALSAAAMLSLLAPALAPDWLSDAGDWFASGFATLGAWLLVLMALFAVMFSVVAFASDEDGGVIGAGCVAAVLLFGGAA